MKLSSITSTRQTRSNPDKNSGDQSEGGAHLATASTTELQSHLQEQSHLLCLNQQEALMLFGLMQAASRHEPTRRTLLSGGDYAQFHRQLSRALANSLGSPA